ncbi:MAG: lectin-like protein, partial [Planctomycetota bacterium]
SADCNGNGRPDSCDITVIPAGAVQWTVSSGGNGHWYMRSTSPAENWTTANAAAIAAHGHLVTITSPEEGAFIASRLVSTAPNTWIGLVQTIGSAEPLAGWHWSTGEEFTYSNWAQGTPNDYPSAADGEENQVVMLPSGLWNDWNLARTASSIIEWSNAPENDCDLNGTPDSCQADCDNDGIPNVCEIAAGAADVDLDGIPDSCECANADLTLDGIVGGDDLAIFLANWGSSTYPCGDFDNNGSIGGGDLSILLAKWGIVH